MYITVSEANTYLQTSGQDDVVTTYISQAEDILNSLCNIESFEDESVTERHNFNDQGLYCLRRLPRGDAITAINDSNVSLSEGVDYVLSGRKLLFSSSQLLTPKSIEFNFIEFTYTSGFATIPQDIKNAMYIIVSGLQAKSKGVGVSSFTQGDISVTYTNEDQLFGSSVEQNNILTRIIGKYKFIDIYSV